MGGTGMGPIGGGYSGDPCSSPAWTAVPTIWSRFVRADDRVQANASARHATYLWRFLLCPTRRWPRARSSNRCAGSPFEAQQDVRGRVTGVTRRTRPPTRLPCPRPKVGESRPARRSDCREAPAPTRLSGDEQADAGVEAKLAPLVEPDGNLVGGSTSEPSVDLEGHPRALLVSVRKFGIEASFDTDDRSVERERSLAKGFGAVLLDGAHQASVPPRYGDRLLSSGGPATA